MIVGGTPIPINVIGAAALIVILSAAMYRLAFNQQKREAKEIVSRALEDFGVASALFTAVYALGAFAGWQVRAILGLPLPADEAYLFSIKSDSVAALIVQLVAISFYLFGRLFEGPNASATRSALAALASRRSISIRKIALRLLAMTSLGFFAWGGAAVAMGPA